MATRPKSYITADMDVNLDFLTKEEKEALLSKKMDMIRQRNRALTERHKLIEADKKKAEEAGQAVKPTVDSQTFPAEGVPKSRGRGRGQHNKDGNRPAMERPKSSGDFRDSSNYEPIVDMTDLINYRSRGRGTPHERDVPNNNSKNKRKPASKEEATTFSSNFEYEPIVDTKDLDNRFGPLLNTLEVGSWSHTDHPDVMISYVSRRACKGRLRDSEGPPPDPSFNPLADRRRSDKKEDSSLDHRRHPRNYGGSTDLTRVKQSMKNMREKERERPQGNKPLEMVMTGKERRNHEEWKAERDKYDKERIQRQMSDVGNWRRAWDADKMSQENNEESASYSSKVEPAKRPAGRIGSGRFDRGERDDRPRSAIIGKGTLQHADQSQQQQRQQHHHDQQQMQPQLHPHHSITVENKAPRGRGRGRGRGRSRGNVPGEKFPRPRTWSGGDDRFVECQKELLLVKFDNTAGDNSVEVEYDDDEFLASPTNTPKMPQSGTTPGRGPTGRTPNQVPKQQSHGGKQQQQQKNKAPIHKDKSQIDAQQQSQILQVSLDQPATAYGTDETRVCTSSHSQSYGDSEEWEDCTESSGIHDDEDFGISVDVLSGTTTNSNSLELHMECRLNPEAPEFLPCSPDLITPSEQAELITWNANSNLSSPLSQSSLTSPQPLVHGLSTSPHPHTINRFPGSSARMSQEKTDIVLKVDQTSPLSSDNQSVSHKIPKMKQMEDDAGLIGDTSGKDIGDRKYTKPQESAESQKSIAKSAEIKDVSVPCLTSHGKNTTSPSVTEDIENAASDALNKLEEDGVYSSEAVSPQDKTTNGLFSAFIAKGLEQTSSSEMSQDASKESVTIIATEIIQNNVVAKDLLKEVSRMHDPVEDCLQIVSVCANKIVNGDESSKDTLNEESALSYDCTDAPLPEKEDSPTNSPKEECDKQEDLKVPAEHLAAKNCGPCYSSDVIIPAGSQSCSLKDESAPPTADVSALS